MCHDLPHAATCARLPAGVELAYDGLDFRDRSLMQVIHYPDDPRPARWHQPVLALGNFDGMHRGHLKIIERVRRGAEERGATAVAMTFDPHPSKIVRPDKAPPLLMTNQQKLDALARAGMHGVAIVRFTPELAQWDPETFVRTVLVEWLHVAEVWVGANFLFGHDRPGNFSTAAKPRRALRLSRGEDRPGPLQGVRRQQHAHPAADCRRAGRRGGRAARPSLRDRRHRSCRGSSAGAGLGFPTANLCSENELVPPRGVYATTATLDGMAYPSITNIGTRPTFEKRRGERHRDARARFRQGSLRREAAAGIRAAAARREEVRRRRGAEGADRGRSQRSARGSVRSDGTLVTDAMRLYNTLTRTRRRVHALEDNLVRMYACGLTVYSRGHIGNFRTFVAVDVLRRTLKYLEGYTVRHVMNFTDVDDRTIAGAQKAGMPLREYTNQWIDAFLEDARALGLEDVEERPRATDQENLDAMAQLVRSLETNGHTYESDGSVYFKISTLPQYGRLARLDHDGLKAGARVDSDNYDKDNARDFVLWKATKPDEPSWDFGFGRGRPGWHLECSAMALRLLGEPPIDIHCGGIDLIFPHHENEIAQSEGATNKPFARFWMHVEHC